MWTSWPAIVLYWTVSSFLLGMAVGYRLREAGTYYRRPFEQ